MKYRKRLREAKIMDIAEYNFYKKLTSLPYVEEIWLFGSRARGDQRDRSDIDLAIYCPLATQHDWLTVANIIDTADTLLHIDCLRLDQLDTSSPIKASITQQGIQLYGQRKN
jgi:uncharacterized protein